MQFFDFFQNGEWRRWRVLLGLLILFAIFFFGNAMYGLYQKSESIRIEQEKKEAELSAIREKRSALQSEIDFMKTDSALEREAKSRLNYKKEGEEVVVIIPEADHQASGTPDVAASWVEEAKKILTNFFRQLGL